MLVVAQGLFDLEEGRARIGMLNNGGHRNRSIGCGADGAQAVRDRLRLRDRTREGIRDDVFLSCNPSNGEVVVQDLFSQSDDPRVVDA